MSDVAATVTQQRDGAGPPPLPPPTYQLLGRVRRIGYLLLGLQAVGFLIWSVVLYEHFSLTVDFSQYGQGWFLIAHGDLDPYSTILRNLLWHNDGELIPYVLAPLYWIWHSGLVLSLAQLLSVVGAEVVAFTWLCDLARRHCAERDAALLVGLGVLLFVACPWLWWALGFDVHMEPVVIFFAVYMAWDLSRGKRRTFAWAVPVLLGGAPTTTYLIGIGLGGVLASRRTRRLGAALAALGIAYFLFLSLVHGNGAAASQSHGVLATGLDHPFRLVQELWRQRTDIIANLAPGGLLGIAVPMIMPFALEVVIENTLSLHVFTEPSFQNAPLYVLLPVGTVAVLAWLLRRHRRVAFALAAVVAAQAIGWAAVWGPRTPGQWLRISNAESATLASVAARIPASAEVAASQGVLGRYSERALAYALTEAELKVPLKADTWFIITPTSGIQTMSQATSMALIGELAGPLHATLITHANGVWAFRLNPRPGLRSVMVPGLLSPLPAWAAEGAAGSPVLNGPVSGWHMAATGAMGYVADGIEWERTPPGRYLAHVTLSTTGPVNVEVWNNTTGSVLLARQHILATSGIQTITLPVNATVPYRATAYSGWGPFRVDLDQPPAGERIEVRVWSPGNTLVNVYGAYLTTPAGTAPSPSANPLG